MVFVRKMAAGAAGGGTLASAGGLVYAESRVVGVGEMQKGEIRLIFRTPNLEKLVLGFSDVFFSPLSQLSLLCRLPL